MKEKIKKFFSKDNLFILICTFLIALFVVASVFYYRNDVKNVKDHKSSFVLNDDYNNLYQNVTYGNNAISWEWSSYVPQVISTMSEYIVHYENDGEYDYALDVSSVNGLFDVYQKNGKYYCGLNFNKLPNKFRNTNNHLQINISNNWYDVNSIDIDVYDGLKFNLADKYIWDIYLNCVDDVSFFSIFNNCDFGVGSDDLANVHYFYNDYGDDFVQARVIGRDRYFFEFYLYSNHSNSSSYIYNLDYTYINGMFCDLFTFDKFNYSNNNFENEDIFEYMLDYNSWFNSYYVTNLQNQNTNLQNQNTNLQNQVIDLQNQLNNYNAIIENSNVLLNYKVANFYYNNSEIYSSNKLESEYDVDSGFTYLDLYDGETFEHLDYIEVLYDTITIDNSLLYVLTNSVGPSAHIIFYNNNFNVLDLNYPYEVNDTNTSNDLPFPIELYDSYTFNKIRVYNLNPNNTYGPGGNKLYLSSSNASYNYLLGYQVGFDKGSEALDSLQADYDNLDNSYNSLNNTYNTLLTQYNNLANNEYTFSELFWSISSVPFGVLASGFNVNVLGVNLAAIITGLFTALLIIWLIKKFLK